MTQPVPDLLPAEEVFATDEDDPAPIQILLTQGRLLGQRTKGEVQGEVEPVQAAEAPTATPTTSPGTLPKLSWPSAPSGEEARIRFWFCLYAPALDYRFRLFFIEHGEDTYPLKIIRSRGGAPIVAASREQFFECVRTLLSEERTVKLVRQMRQLVKARALGGR